MNNAQLKKFHDLPIGSLYHHRGTDNNVIWQKISSREGQRIPPNFPINTLIYEIEE